MKIEQIKLDYSELYFQRILICLGISIVLIGLFTALNTSINFCLKWFYRKDKEISSEIDNYENINSLTEQLSQSIENNKLLESQIKDLRNINKSLTLKSLDIKVSDISKKDYNNLLSHINSKYNKEKLLFSLKELINTIKNNSDVEIIKLTNSATYYNEMNELISLLEELNLLGSERIWKNSNDVYIFKLTPSFKDFLKMEL